MPLSSLDKLTGRRVRVTLPPLAHEPPVSVSPSFHLFGVLSQCCGCNVTIELESIPPSHMEHTLAGVEVLHADGLFRFQLQLAIPTEVSSTCLRGRVDSPIDWVQRRRHIRAAVEMQCTCWDATPHARSSPWTAQITNVGAGGVALRSSRPAQHGDRLMMTLPGIAGLSGVPILAEVLRTKVSSDGIYDLGLRFLSLSPTQEDAINRHVIWVNARVEVSANVDKTS